MTQGPDYSGAFDRPAGGGFHWPWQSEPAAPPAAPDSDPVADVDLNDLASVQAALEALGTDPVLSNKYPNAYRYLKGVETRLIKGEASRQKTEAAKKVLDNVDYDNPQSILSGRRQLIALGDNAAASQLNAYYDDAIKRDGGRVGAAAPRDTVSATALFQAQERQKKDEQMLAYYTAMVRTGDLSPQKAMDYFTQYLGGPSIGADRRADQDLQLKGTQLLAEYGLPAGTTMAPGSESTMAMLRQSGLPANPEDYRVSTVPASFLNIAQNMLQGGQGG